MLQQLVRDMNPVTFQTISIVAFLFSLATIRTTVATNRSQTSEFDSPAIAKELGQEGETQEDVYKISLPRTDLTVTVDGIKVAPGFALGSWIAFKPVPHEAGEAVAHGDLVLTEGEVRPVVAELQRQGFQITALHNHLINESPRVMYLHFWSTGDPARLARGVKQALTHTQTPIGQTKDVDRDPSFPEAERILNTMGHKGPMTKGVLKVSVPRSETIKTPGVDVPSSMGMATALNFQRGRDGNVLATGDFVLTAQEVNLVAKVLVERGITVTALHNHLLQASPDLYFMHFWANDAADKVAEGLKAGLDVIKRENGR